MITNAVHPANVFLFNRRHMFLEDGYKDIFGESDYLKEIELFRNPVERNKLVDQIRKF